jgi:hypothetical protein
VKVGRLASAADGQVVSEQVLRDDASVGVGVVAVYGSVGYRRRYFDISVGSHRHALLQPFPE